jgi:hypothetical protein
VSGPVAKGLLVYADGRTEPVEPYGKVIVKPCKECGTPLHFDSDDGCYATNENTISPTSDEKLLVMSRSDPGRFNAGVVVYVQKRAKR